MKYQVKISLNVPRDIVIQNYLDSNAMFEWEKGLSKIESIQGSLFEQDSIGFLYFTFGEQTMKMKVTNEIIDIPHRIVQIYEVPGAWNRCDNRFSEIDHQTEWIMDVEFRFDLDPGLPMERFFEKTKAGMHLFKTYIEGKKHA